MLGPQVDFTLKPGRADLYSAAAAVIWSHRKLSSFFSVYLFNTQKKTFLLSFFSLFFYEDFFFSFLFFDFSFPTNKKKSFSFSLSLSLFLSFPLTLSLIFPVWILFYFFWLGKSFTFFFTSSSFWLFSRQKKTLIFFEKLFLFLFFCWITFGDWITIILNSLHCNCTTPYPLSFFGSISIHFSSTHFHFSIHFFPKRIFFSFFCGFFLDFFISFFFLLVARIFFGYFFLTFIASDRSPGTSCDNTSTNHVNCKLELTKTQHGN